MKNKNRILTIAALVAIMLISCPQEPGDTGGNNGNPHEPTVYLCTVTNTGAYWVNGTKRGDLDIPGGAQILSYYNLGCTVSGGKVYVWGRYSDSGSDKYAYWVDGVRTDITSPAGEIYGLGLIAVSDGKVYVWGNSWDGDYAYWVNGVRTDLGIPDGYIASNPPSFTVSNGKVYAAGGYHSYHYDDDGYYKKESSKACYWVDGVRNDLSVPVGIEFSETRNITVSGGKAYVVGSYGNYVDIDGQNDIYSEKACYWVDGIRADLNIPAETENSRANAIIVSGGKVYVSGSYGNYVDIGDGSYSYVRYMGKACYWVDGVRTDLSVPAGTEMSSAYNLIVSGGKVYMLGEIDSYNYGDVKFCYWADGTRTDLVVPNEAIDFWPYNLTVSDGKVYVSGNSIERVSSYRGAYYWVDGVRTDIDVPGYVFFGSLRGWYFAVVGGKVYIATGGGDFDQGVVYPDPFEMAFYWIVWNKTGTPRCIQHCRYRAGSRITA